MPKTNTPPVVTRQPPADVEVTKRGEIPNTAVRYAEEKMRRVQRHTTEPVLSCRVVLSRALDPARERPALAEASLELGGVKIRAQAAAETLEAAVDLVANRLQRSLVQHQDRQVSRHRWLAAHLEHEWRHGTLPTERLDHFPRPPAEREVVRRKTFALEPMTVDEAAFDMDLLGHSFYLFRDIDTGTDALVQRTRRGGFAVRGELAPPESAAVKVVHEGAAPRLDEQQARTRLELSGEPFVFYVDPRTRRGRVLYVRYDGHYGLVEAV
ncbi:MAG TPA: HPF/RaiA family ribosome-associated protein [Nocardioidaceae bacterium]|nr:HPF/RaiA family ribosome-associated protein [Nocardioidaceae bacterium]